MTTPDLVHDCLKLVSDANQYAADARNVHIFISDSSQFPKFLASR
jgi:hypothetical protein